MMNVVAVPLADIYVPVKLRKTLDEAEVDKIAESILDDQPQKPIQVRTGKGRFVLIKGLHRLEAGRALGDVTIDALIVQARRS